MRVCSCGGSVETNAAGVDGQGVVDHACWKGTAVERVTVPVAEDGIRVTFTCGSDPLPATGFKCARSDPPRLYVLGYLLSSTMTPFHPGGGPSGVPCM